MDKEQMQAVQATVDKLTKHNMPTGPVVAKITRVRWLALPEEIRNVLDAPQYQTLRHASQRLHRWYELQCGTDEGHIEYDEKWEHWVKVVDGNRFHIHDRETGAIKKIKLTCEEAGLHFYLQQDPRGLPLYIAREPLKDNDYSTKGTVVQ